MEENIKVKSFTRKYGAIMAANALNMKPKIDYLFSKLSLKQSWKGTEICNCTFPTRNGCFTPC